MSICHVNVLEWLNANYFFNTDMWLCSSCFSWVESLKKIYSHRSVEKSPPIEMNIILHWNHKLNKPDFSKSKNLRLKCPGRNERGRFTKKEIKPEEKHIKLNKRGTQLREVTSVKKNALINKIKKGDETGIIRFNAGRSKGKGVKTIKMFNKEEFVAVYKGIDLTEKEAKARIAEYERRKCGSYLYEFFLNGKKHFKDATQNDYSLGRFINHGKEKGNLKANKIEIDSVAYLYFTAKCDIPINQEILYDYNDAKSDLKWMKK